MNEFTAPFPLSIGVKARLHTTLADDTAEEGPESISLLGASHSLLHQTRREQHSAPCYVLNALTSFPFVGGVGVAPFVTEKPVPSLKASL